MDVAQFIAYAIAAVGFVSGLVGYYGKSRGDSIIRYQAKDVVALKSLNETLEKEKTALIAERDGYKRENDTLKGLAQGSPQLIKLTTEISKLTTQVAKIAKDNAKGRGK